MKICQSFHWWKFELANAAKVRKHGKYGNTFADESLIYALVYFDLIIHDLFSGRTPWFMHNQFKSFVYQNNTVHPLSLESHPETLGNINIEYKYESPRHSISVPTMILFWTEVTHIYGLILFLLIQKKLILNLLSHIKKRNWDNLPNADVHFQY